MPAPHPQRVTFLSLRPSSLLILFPLALLIYWYLSINLLTLPGWSSDTKKLPPTLLEKPKAPPIVDVRDEHGHVAEEVEVLDEHGHGIGAHNADTQSNNKKEKSSQDIKQEERAASKKDRDRNNGGAVVREKEPAKKPQSGSSGGSKVQGSYSFSKRKDWDEKPYWLPDDAPKYLPVKKGDRPTPAMKTRRWPTFDIKAVARCDDFTPKMSTNAEPRNYYEDPVMVLHNSALGGVAPQGHRAMDNKNFNEYDHCDIPCTSTSSRHWNTRADLIMQGVLDGSAGSKVCGHQRFGYSSMESDLNYPPYGVERYANAIKSGQYDLLATYDFRSDVTMQYYSWDEYNLPRPVSPKTANGHVFAAISNCGARERLDWLSVLQANGVYVHHYGGCNHNRDFAKGGGARNQKFETAATYLFTNAMENGKTPYYVTEKLIDALVSGSVPIHMGVDDLRPFAPREKSVLNTADFEGAANMATLMKTLMANTTAYDEYLEWKTGGTTRDFRSTMDISIVHSTCRLCIRVADMNRWKFNWVHDVDKEQNPYAESNEAVLAAAANEEGVLRLRVRERGLFWFHVIVLRERTMAEFRSEVAKKMSPFGAFQEYYDAKLVRKSALDPITVIDTDDGLAALPEYSELEVVLFYY